MTNSVQSTSVSDTAALLQKQKDFQDGKVNIKKDDLQQSVLSAIKSGKNVDVATQSLIDSYDKIDKNGDGVSYTELKAYKNTPQGLLASLGINSNSITQNLPTLLDSGLFDDSSSSSSASSLLSSLSSSASSNNAATSKLLASLSASSGVSTDTTSGLRDLLNSGTATPEVTNAINSYLEKSGQTDSSSIKSLLDVLS